MFEIGGCEEVWSSIFWAQRRGKREHQMKGVAEQKVSDWQMQSGQKCAPPVRLLVPHNAGALSATLATGLPAR